MPRRMITSDIWLNERFAGLPDQARLLFIGIITNADDDGRLRASPAYLKARVFPYDTQKTQPDILDWRTQCEQANLIGLYSVNGTDYLFLPGWTQHQRIRKDRHSPSDLPSPPNNHPATTRQPTGNHNTEDEEVTPEQPTDDRLATNRRPSRGKDSIVEDSKVEGDPRPNIFREYESNIGMLTPAVSDELRVMEAEFPEEWVVKAIQRACLRNHRSLSYVKGILRRWHRDGYDEGTEGEMGRKDGGGGRQIPWEQVERDQREEEEAKGK